MIQLQVNSLAEEGLGSRQVPRLVNGSVRLPTEMTRNALLYVLKTHFFNDCCQSPPQLFRQTSIVPRVTSGKLHWF